MNIPRPGAFSPIFVAFALVTVSGCAARTSPAPLPARPVGPSQSGLASWYGPGFHGKMTASGERYNMLGLTAAHKKLPFGAYVRVDNLANDRSLVVRINDRGPFVRGRIIDLSYAAAKVLAMTGAGVVKVRIQVLESRDGARIHRLQERMVSEGGIRTWSDSEYRVFAALAKGA